MWVPPSEYVTAEPDPLRNVSEKIVEEMNSRHAEDVSRLCNVYVDIGFQASFFVVCSPMKQAYISVCLYCVSVKKSGLMYLTIC